MAIRYRKSSEPVVTDGRDIDRNLAELTGEASSQRASGSSDEHLAEVSSTWQHLPQPQRQDLSYYDRPLLNDPVWEWAIPTYYYIGGVTGASLVLAAAVQISHPRSRLVRFCRHIGLAGVALSAALLIYDLGVPSRFLNMLRVFRPTSPMNMGAWILSGTGGTVLAAVALPECSAKSIAGWAAGLFGAALATYTGVLVSNSTVPVWSEARRVLPILFGGSAMASTGCVLAFLSLEREASGIVKTFGLAGQLAELSSSLVLEKQVRRVPRVAKPLSTGLSGFLWRSSAVLTACSVVLNVGSKASRRRRTCSAVVGTLGSLLLRFAIHHAGTVSARDARASFYLQHS